MCGFSKEGGKAPSSFSLVFSFYSNLFVAFLLLFRFLPHTAAPPPSFPWPAAFSTSLFNTSTASLVGMGLVLRSGFFKVRYIFFCHSWHLTCPLIVFSSTPASRRHQPLPVPPSTPQRVVFCVFFFFFVVSLKLLCIFRCILPYFLFYVSIISLP